MFLVSPRCWIQAVDLLGRTGCPRIAAILVFTGGQGQRAARLSQGGAHRDKETSLPIVSRLQASEPGWLSATQLAVLATTTNPNIANASRKGSWVSRAARGCPCIPPDRGLGRSAALATIAGENFDLVHAPLRLVHGRGGVGEFDFFWLPAFTWSSQWPFRTPQGVRYGVMWSGCGSEGVAS